VLLELGRSVMSEIELRLATRRLAERNERLQQLDRERNELVAVVSHDLRAPLTAVLASLALLQEDHRDQLAEEQLLLLRVVERNARRVLRLADDLLVVARADAGRLDIEHAEVDLAAVARESVETASARAEDSRVALGLRTDGRALVWGDAQRLGQVIDNLVGNAIKFTPAGGQVSVSVERRNGHVHLEVADTGIGISEAEHEQVFERFYRAEAARKGLEGTGLGLTIVKTLVEAHRGSLSVDSEPGAGTTFAVDLPNCW
jgi:signal transduction histidine kinase